MTDKTKTERNADQYVPVKPITDVYETELDFNFEIEMPNVDKKNMAVHYKNGVLSVEGTPVEYREESNRSGYSRFIRFERKFSLNKEINAEKIQAKVENAVLKISIPKMTVLPPQSIPIA